MRPCQLNFSDLPAKRPLESVVCEPQSRAYYDDWSNQLRRDGEFDWANYIADTADCHSRGQNVWWRPGGGLPGDRIRKSDGLFESEMVDLIAPFVFGKHVHDLGCGDFSHAWRLMKAGAAHVTGIDKVRMDIGELQSYKNVTFRVERFEDFSDDVDVAYCSWPHNYDTGLARILRYARMIIVLGKQTDGTMCGDLTFWQELKKREVLRYRPMRKESLIVYGPGIVNREPIADERAACDYERYWSYERMMAQHIADSGGHVEFGPGRAGARR